MKSNKRSWNFAFTVPICIGLALWGAHFGKATRTIDGTPFPPMNSTLEFLIHGGRILAIVCLVLAFIIGTIITRKVEIKYLRGSALTIIVLNLYLALKLSFYRSDDFFIMSISVICLTTLSVVIVLSSIEWLSITRPENRYSSVANSIWIFGLLIIATNVIAVLFYPQSTINDSARLHGTTVNPQHLAMMCAMVAPAATFKLLQKGPFALQGILSLAMLFGCIVIIYMTGSRAGIAAFILGLIISLKDYIFYRHSFKRAMIFGYIFFVTFLLFQDEITNAITARFIDGREDTRSENWLNASLMFFENPIFGVEPSGENGRLPTVENFWLASAIGGGIFGVLLSTMALIQMLRSLSIIQHLPRSSKFANQLSSFYSSGLAVALVICIFEAAPLGIIASHTMILYAYASCAYLCILFIKYIDMPPNSHRTRLGSARFLLRR